MRRVLLISGVLLALFTVLLLTASGIVPAIVPALVPAGNKTSTTSTVFALSSSNALTASSPVCTNANGDMTTTACTVNAVTSTSPVTVNTNTTNDQQLMELSLTAGYLNSLGRPFDFFGAGVYTTQTGQTPTLEMKIKLCTVSGCGSGTVVSLVDITTTATTANSPNVSWNLRALGTTSTTGATGNLEIHGNLTADLGNLISASDTIFTDTNTGTSSNIDLTAALFVDFTIKFSTNAATANTMTQREGVVSPGGSTSGGGGGGVTSVNGLTGVVVTTGPMNPTITAPPVLASWTLDNGGGNGTTANTTGGVLINSVSGNTLKVLSVAAPAPSGTAFTLQAGLSAVCIDTQPDIGLAVGDTGAKWELLAWSPGAGHLTVTDWTNSSTFSGTTPFDHGNTPLTTTQLWFQIKYDGTSLIYYVSPTGADSNSYIQLFSHAATTFLATNPAKLGFEGHSQNTGFPCIVTLWHWKVTTP